MANGHQAGTLIFNQLKTFNDSVLYFENVLCPALFSGIDACVETFFDNKKNDWKVKSKLADEDEEFYCELQPVDWVITQDDNESEKKASFLIRFMNDDISYYAAVLCGLSNTGGEAGFMFERTNAFCLKKPWQNHIKKAGKILDDILALGFKNMDDGKFFLPIKLDPLLLANTWDESGKFAHDDECFLPIRKVLETLDKSVPLFDALMQSCQSNTK